MFSRVHGRVQTFNGVCLVVLGRDLGSLEPLSTCLEFGSHAHGSEYSGSDARNVHGPAAVGAQDLTARYIVSRGHCRVLKMICREQVRREGRISSN